MGRDVPCGILILDLGWGNLIIFVYISNRVHLLSDFFRGLGRISSKFITGASRRGSHCFEPQTRAGDPAVSFLDQDIRSVESLKGHGKLLTLGFTSFRMGTIRARHFAVAVIGWDQGMKRSRSSIPPLARRDSVPLPGCSLLFVRTVHPHLPLSDVSLAHPLRNPCPPGPTAKQSTRSTLSRAMLLPSRPFVHQVADWGAWLFRRCSSIYTESVIA